MKPYQAPNAGRFAAACREAVENEELRTFAMLGSADQLIEMTEAFAQSRNWSLRMRFSYS